LNLLQAWAALEYLDEVLGRLFDYLKTSGLDKSTYVMLLSDNGSALLPNEGSKANRQVRTDCRCLASVVMAKHHHSCMCFAACSERI
jgi:arylsulfatase A-like enzyme